jgi:transaldolase
MKRTQALHDAGQSIWLDNITRTLLDRGILDRYIARYSVTGLTSNPTILDNAIKEGTDYDADIAARKATGASDEVRGRSGCCGPPPRSRIPRSRTCSM